jgi:hypothetical protein
VRNTGKSVNQLAAKIGSTEAQKIQSFDRRGVGWRGIDRNSGCPGF